MNSGLKIIESLKEEYYRKGYWTSRTILDEWNDCLAKNGDREYVCDDQGARMTYSEVDDKASRLAGWLVERGIEPGDVVSVQYPTWAEFAVAYVACLKAGAIIHPLALAFGLDDLAYCMNRVDTKAYLFPACCRNHEYEKQALAVMRRVPTLTTIAAVEKGTVSSEGITLISDIIATHKPIAEEVKRSSDDIAVILTTSGTTGRTKAAMLTHNNVLASERAFVKGYRRTQDDVMWMPAPMNHAVGFFHGLVAPMLLGGRSVLQEHFEPASAVRLINQENVTWTMCSTPFVYDLMRYLDKSGESIPSMEVWACGGAPVPSSLIEHANRHGFLLSEVYGSTESCPHTFVPVEHCLAWDGAWSGVPMDGIEVRVIDENGNDVPAGVQGEEISRGPHLFVGYFGEKDRTDKALDDEGWFHSGDLCYMDEQGRIRINGRKKEIIIRGGENISAREVDDNLVGCPGIRECATIGAPDDRLGERICTFVVPEEGCTPTVESVTAFLASHSIPKRVWPERIELIDQLPYTPLGKIKRFELTAELKDRMAVGNAA